MRGRDIKKFAIEFADLYLINTHNGYLDRSGNQVNSIKIEDYPAIKKHLDLYFTEIEKRSDKGKTLYNLRNCAYIEDFYKQKIIWIELADIGRFAFDKKDKYFTLNVTFIMLGNDLEYICSCLLYTSRCV